MCRRVRSHSESAEASDAAHPHRWKGPVMPRPQTMPNPISSIPDEHALPILTDRAKDFISVRLARGEDPERIAAALRGLFEIEIDGDQVISCWRAHHMPPTQTG